MEEHYFDELAMAFEAHADPVIAAGAKAYMRNISEFYGIPSPLRNTILKSFIDKNGLPPDEDMERLVYYAWNQPQREWQYTMMQLVEKSLKRAEPAILQLAEWMIIHKSWWDTVDFVAPNIAGYLFKKYPDTRTAYIEKWITSGNLWLQRSCLLHQLRYHASTDQDLLFGLCERLAAHPDFFIRKAIGWSLRQHSKSSPEAVVTFVNNHPLSPLSRKEALKIIDRKK